MDVYILKPVASGNLHFHCGDLRTGHQTTVSSPRTNRQAYILVSRMYSMQKQNSITKGGNSQGSDLAVQERRELTQLKLAYNKLVREVACLEQDRPHINDKTSISEKFQYDAMTRQIDGINDTLRDMDAEIRARDPHGETEVVYIISAAQLDRLAAKQGASN